MKKGKLKIGIVGSGIRGLKCFAVGIEKRNDAEITALCDPNPVRMREGAKRLNGKLVCYTKIEDMLRRERLDAAVITSPDHCHESNAVVALEKGVNVLIDKPLATTVKGCEHIRDAARKAGKIAMVGFNLRHEPTIKRLKRIIDDGVLGKVFLIENREFYPGGRSYMSRWNRKYALSGGLWVHKGSHDFDVFNWLLGFPKPRKVSSFAGVSVFSPKNIPFKLDKRKKPGPTCHECPYGDTCPDKFDILKYPEFSDEARAVDKYAKDLCMYLSDKDVHDNGFAIVEYENGVRASHTECFATSLHDRLYTVVGDKGQAEVSLDRRTILVRPRWSAETITYELPAIEGGHGGADPGLIDHFIKTISGEGETNSTLDHGLLSTAIGQAAEIARREERVVFMEELLAKSP